MLRGIPIPELGTIRESLLYEMIRHQRFIEADKWELLLRVAASLQGQKWEDANKIAALVRQELMLSLDHITPSLDYSIARAEARLRKGGVASPRTAAMVESWGVENEESQ